MENFKSLEKVKSFTQEFPWQENQRQKLEENFDSLAKYFLYGGYIRVLDRYRVYIQRVEFYFHSEKKDGIKDDIVYHRNDYHVEGKLPYFLPFTLHAHASGFDIAFENPEKEYRASVLIRAYEIYDEQEKRYVNYKKAYDEQSKKWIDKEDKFVYSVEPLTNTQSTYLYDILNGFGSAGTITWVHELSALYNNHQPLEPTHRKGVYDKTREQWQDTKYDEPRDRNWSFSRKESIKDLI